MVTDNITNLIWQDDKEAKTVKKKWEDAKIYCGRLTLGGRTDWRLPTIVELQNIMINGNNPAIDTTVFLNYTTSKYYWSSITNASNTSLVWGVHFGNGGTGVVAKTSSKYVRCVRAGQ